MLDRMHDLLNQSQGAKHAKPAKRGTVTHILEHFRADSHHFLSGLSFRNQLVQSVRNRLHLSAGEDGFCAVDMT
jgi:hypothetical protein